MELKQDKYDVEKPLGDYLSLLQLKFDCETVYNLITALQRDGVTGFGIIPYITLTTYATLELLEANANNNANQELKIRKMRAAAMRPKR